MIYEFVVPLFQGQIKQIGFSILWIPTVVAGVVALCITLWVIKKPWNLKKFVYAVLIFLSLAMGAGVMHFAKARLLSIIFRLFTCISTWEMVGTEALLGNCVVTC